MSVWCFDSSKKGGISKSLLRSVSVLFVFLIATIVDSQTNRIDAKQPDIQFLISTQNVRQGDSIRLDIISSQLWDNTVSHFAGSQFSFFLISSSNAHKKPPYHYRQYIGVSRDLEPKAHTLTVEVNQTKGKTYRHQWEMQVGTGNFDVSDVTFAPQKTELVNKRTQLSSEAVLMGQKFGTLSDQRHFSDPFIMPSAGVISTGFGAFRRYNGRYSAKHSGVDIANKIGTPVVAANTGTVVLSESFQSHGETIMIDHGWGIVTVYLHLSERTVDSGQFVHRGDVIGLMGESGIATGPNVHWGLSVQGVRVNPLQWTTVDGAWELF